MYGISKLKKTVKEVNNLIFLSCPGLQILNYLKYLTLILLELLGFVSFVL